MITKRALNYTVEMNVPFTDKIEKFLFKNEIAVVRNGTLIPRQRKKLVNLTDLEVVTTYNAELRGLC
ncbi:MAG: group II intron reverse transcriptase/maturase, partial [Clostridiales bacterium]|nr:group II intron reverse transcriptase/maturase [Clostridiales bacterium]